MHVLTTLFTICAIYYNTATGDVVQVVYLSGNLLVDCEVDINTL